MHRPNDERRRSEQAPWRGVPCHRLQHNGRRGRRAPVAAALTTLPTLLRRAAVVARPAPHPAPLALPLLARPEAVAPLRLLVLALAALLAWAPVALTSLALLALWPLGAGELGALEELGGHGVDAG